MALEKYNSKRDFSSTTEPKGKKLKEKNEKRFVIQYHQARAKHFDFRLEWGGVLLSWAVPKGLSFNPKVKRLAVMVEDHPLDYINFEGVIPKGNYGAGTVEIFDKGSYLPLEDFNRGLKKGHIKFVLNGEKHKGEWSLIRTDEKNWLIVKQEDKFASNKELSLNKRKNSQKLPIKSASPMLATLSSEIPSGSDWLFEIKYDGYRVLSFIENSKVKLVSRNGLDYTKKFVSIAESLKNLSKNCVLDGEVVAFDESGRSDFGLLQERIKNGGQVFYAVFDILALADRDVRNLPFQKRREILEELLKEKLDFVILSSGVVDKGRQSFAFAKKMGLEGIVAKNLNSLYVGKRSEDWLKIKCYKRQEFVIVGYTKTEKNSSLSALILGYFEKGKLKKAGKTGTGFSDETRKNLALKLKKLKSGESLDKKEKSAIWVEPKLVAEIKFAELTKDGLLRQASFVGLREDKKVQDVKLERAHGK